MKQHLTSGSRRALRRGLALAAAAALLVPFAAACSDDSDGGTDTATTGAATQDAGTTTQDTGAAEQPPADEGDSGSSEDQGSSSNGVVNLVFAASVFGDPGQGDTYLAMLESFNDSHPNIQVSTAAIPFERLATTVTTQMAGGRGPDIIRFDINDFYAIQQDGLVAELPGLDGTALGLEPNSDSMCLFDGKRYCVVFQTAAHALIYNADLIETPPTNFDEFLALAKEVTNGDVYGFAFRTSLAEEPGVWGDLWNWAVGYGGQFSKDGVLTVNDPGIIEGAKKYQEMYNSGAIPKGASASEYRAMFGEGKLAMEIDSASLIGLLLGMDPDLNLGAVPNPFPVRNQNEVFAVLAVNQASPNVAAAEEFLAWWVEESQQTIVQSAVVAGAAAIPAVRSEEDLAEHPYYPVFDELVATARPGIVVGFETQTPAIRKIVVEEFVNALETDGDMQVAFDTAQQRCEEELDL